MRCFRCGTNNRATAKFCDSCGTVLSDAGREIAATKRNELSVTGERRHLTVLFCDLVDSTSIASKLDPEEWRDVLAEYHHVTANAIERFGGYIAQYLGDGVMAYFGWPEAHENDAERAAHAGLAIVNEIANLNPRLGHTKLSVRVGIDSGAVVVGASTGKSADVFGDVPNIAARTQTIAEPDTILATGAAQRLMSGMFVVEHQGARSLKGVDGPVQLYRIIRPSGARGRFEAVATTRGLTRFVGREHELTLLMDRWQRALKGEGQAVLLVAEPGIGKSRLVAQFHEQIAGTQHGWAHITASPLFHNTPFYPVADLVRGLRESYGKLGRADEILAEQRSRRRTRSDGQSVNGGLRQKENRLGRFESAFDSKLDPPPIAQLFLAAQADDPESPPASVEQRRRLLFRTVEWVLGAASVMPLALAIEDLHWADPSTRELIELLTKECSRVPLMLLCTARPEFRLTTEAGARLVSVRLNPLNVDNARAIVEEVAGQTSLPEATIKTVVERAGGVPLFVEELTIAVLESGGARLTGRQIPVTLRDSLMARLDRLGAARETLQLGSVLGIEFSYDLLLAIYPQGEDELCHHLRTLTDAELLYAHGQPPEAHYRIKHALIRDAAYETLLKSRRREIHRKVAKILEEHFPETAASTPELLAHHYTEGGVTAEAVRYWRRAGKKAIERSANLEAISFFRRGLELVTSLPPGSDRSMEELRLQMAVSTPVAATKGYLDPEVEDASKRALELSREIGDSPQLFTVLGGLNSIYFNRGELEVALELGRRMLRLAEAQRNPEMLLWAHYSLGFSLHFRGILKLARYHLERSLAFYDPRKGGTYGFVQDPGPTATMLLAHVLYKLGYPDQALERTRQALAAARSLSHPFTTAWVLGFVGELYWRRGDKLAAQEVWEEMAALSTKQSFKPMIAKAFVFLGFVLVEQGRSEDGIRKMSDGLYSLIDPLPMDEKVHGSGFLSLALGKAGRVDEGLSKIEEALSLANQARTFGDLYLLHLIKGQLFLMKKETGLRKAKQCFSTALKLAREEKAKSDELRAAIPLAKLLAQQGRLEQARSMLQKIYNWFTEGFDTADLKEARALLDELSR